MKDDNEIYRHYVPNIGLSVERNTDNVPDDGRFHIVKGKKVIQSFRSRKLAEEKFRQLLKESGFKPKPAPIESTPLSESVERYAIAKAIFWAEGPKYRRKSGRGGRGGV